MKIFKKIMSLFFALSISALILYADMLFSYPSEITMYHGEPHSARMGGGVFLSDISPNLPVNSSSESVTPLKTGVYDASLSIGGAIPFKKVKINVTPPDYLYASGELIGLRIHNKGLIVIDTTAIEGSGQTLSPAEVAGIQKGDIILEINGSAPQSSGDVSHLIKADKVEVTLSRNNHLFSVSVNPVTDKTDGIPKIGVWVRDSTAGVGTMTYFNPETKDFGALGHSISDSDTGVMFDILKGTVEKSHVVSLKKGTKGSPGEICVGFSSNEISGTIIKNCESGVFGVLTDNSTITGTLYPAAPINQVESGSAYILSNVDNGIKKYAIEILRTNPFGSAAKGLVIKVTDKALIEKTGGIVQGMSGSPIIQNEKLVGAVTHVLVNDPTRGYGIFIEKMLSEST